MTIEEILARFPRLSALVVGDVCLDRWCSYDPAASEASRETGIPRVGVIHTEVTAGAGGTVANNLAALGVGRVAVLSVTGDDGNGFELARALDAVYRAESAWKGGRGDIVTLLEHTTRVLSTRVAASATR